MKLPPPSPDRYRFAPFCPPARPARAFTLIELLASMTVLALLLTVVMQMINSAIAVTAGSAKRIDADSQARLIFDRMAVDFSQIAKRQDTDYYFRKNLRNTSLGSVPTHGNDQMAFYSETTGYYPPGVTDFASKSNMSLVGYRIYENTTGDPTTDVLPRLERLSKALVWNGVTTANGTPRSMTVLPQTLPFGWPTVFSTATDPNASPVLSGIPDMGASMDRDYQAIGEQVFRMEISFLVRNATIPVTFSDTPYLPSPTAAPTVVTTTALPYNGLRDVVAVVVSLAILDNTSRLVVKHADLNATAELLDDQAGSALITPNTQPLTPATLWQSHIDQGDLINTSGKGLPRIAAAQVRVYERYFYLGNTQ